MHFNIIIIFYSFEGQPNTSARLFKYLFKQCWCNKLFYLSTLCSVCLSVLWLQILACLCNFNKSRLFVLNRSTPEATRDARCYFTFKYNNIYRPSNLQSICLILLPLQDFGQFTLPKKKVRSSLLCNNLKDWRKRLKINLSSWLHKGDAFITRCKRYNRQFIKINLFLSGGWWCQFDQINLPL